MKFFEEKLIAGGRPRSRPLCASDEVYDTKLKKCRKKKSPGRKRNSPKKPPITNKSDQETEIETEEETKSVNKQDTNNSSKKTAKSNSSQKSRHNPTIKEIIEKKRSKTDFTPYIKVKISGGTGNGPCMYNSVYRALVYHPFDNLVEVFKMPTKNIEDFLKEYVFTQEWVKKYKYIYYSIKGTKQEKKELGISEDVTELNVKDLEYYSFPNSVLNYLDKSNKLSSFEQFINLVKEVKSNPTGDPKTWGSNIEIQSLRESLLKKHNIILKIHSPIEKEYTKKRINQILMKLEEDYFIDIASFKLKSRLNKKPVYARFFYEENSAPLECDGTPVCACEIPARLQINIWYNGSNHYEALIPKEFENENKINLLDD